MPLLFLRESAPPHDWPVDPLLQNRSRGQALEVIGPMTKLVRHSATPVTVAAAPNLDPLLTRPILAQPDPPLRHQRSGDPVAGAILRLAESAAHPKGHMPCPESPDIGIIAALHSHQKISLADHAARVSIADEENKCTTRPRLPAPNPLLKACNTPSLKQQSKKTKFGAFR